MPLEIPNYDCALGEDVTPASSASPASSDDWDPNYVELDLDELEACLPSR